MRVPLLTLRLIGSPMEWEIDHKSISTHLLPLKHELSSYRFVVTDNCIMAAGANKTRLLSIMSAAVRVVMNKVRKRDVLANGANVEEAVELNPVTTIHRPCPSAIRDCDTAGNQHLFER